MTDITKSTTSYWLATAPGPRHAKLDRDIAVDVAIVGGGVTGITAAFLLQRAGKRVAVLEARRFAGGVTGHTTAHLTEAIDARYVTLIRDFGLEGAKLAARASRGAIELIGGLVSHKRIACGWRRLPGYLYSEREEDLEGLHAEYEAAKKVGLAVEMTRVVPLPFKTAAGIRFDDQAEVHVVEYLLPLVDEIVRNGGLVFEDTRVSRIEDKGPCRLSTPTGTVQADHVVVAANDPLSRVFLQTKIAHYRSYAVAVRVAQPRLPGLFWDTDDPYHYLRSVGEGDEAGSLLIVGGEDHKTGATDDTAARYARLLGYTHERFTLAEPDYQWSSQLIETVDGLPFIGPSTSSKRVYVATGYAGNGITFGTAAAMIVCDGILGRDNPWSLLFEPKRIKPMAGAKDFASENVDFPLHFVGDRLRAAEARDLGDVGRDEGKIVRVRGTKLAVYRDADGALHAFSPVCPHLGCHVRFNDAEKSWDCPCHGSRFATDGSVLDGPATSGLAPRPVDEVKREEAPSSGAARER